MTDEEAKTIIFSRDAAAKKVAKTCMESFTGFYSRIVPNKSPGEVVTADELFWAMCKSPETLKTPFYAEKISEAVADGDVDFLVRLGADLKRKPRLPTPVELALIRFWLIGPSGAPGLCLCSDAAIVDLLNLILDRRDTLDAVRKVRQRLGLKKAKSIRFKKVLRSGGQYWLK